MTTIQVTFSLIFAYNAFAGAQAERAFHEVYVNTQEYVHETAQEFLSIALDSSLIRYGWKEFDFDSEKTKNLARGLYPAYLRIGGTDEDFLLFDDRLRRQRQSAQFEDTKSERMNQAAEQYTNFTMSASDVDDIFHFATATELKVIFGLNVLLREPRSNRWDSENAEKLMRYISGKGFACGWELGNEPVDLKGLVNRTITGGQLAEDFQILRALLDKHPEYGNVLVGPDVSSPWNGDKRPVFLKEFLRNMKRLRSINAMTYHQYYTDNKASVADFYSPEILDLLIKEIQKVKNIIVESGAIVSTWLGETSSSYDGGVPGVSDSFVAGFMWLDKLGVAARLGHKVVIRQSFYGGAYSLIHEKSFDPFPDYWSSLLYKRLVGRRVLEVRGGIALDRKIRIYAHCASEKSIYPRGSVVFIALNTQAHEEELIFTNALQNLPVDQYLLTPGEGGNLSSQTVKLNGAPLALINDTFLPDIQPKRIFPSRKQIVLPPLSYGFFVIAQANAKACQVGGQLAGYINGLEKQYLEDELHKV